jgi:hypothetical protein
MKLPDQHQLPDPHQLARQFGDRSREGDVLGSLRLTGLAEGQAQPALAHSACGMATSYPQKRAADRPSPAGDNHVGDRSVTSAGFVDGRRLPPLNTPSPRPSAPGTIPGNKVDNPRMRLVRGGHLCLAR